MKTAACFFCIAWLLLLFVMPMYWGLSRQTSGQEYNRRICGAAPNRDISQSGMAQGLRGGR